MELQLKALLLGAAIGWAPVLASPGLATAVQIDALDSGWYDDTGFHGPTNENYTVGWSLGKELRHFFVFDLSVFPTESLISASLLLSMPPTLNNPGNGYDSPDASETLQLYDVLTPIATLTAGGSDLTAVYDDLGSGTVFGNVTVTAADNGQVVEIVLNAAALSALDAASGGVFAIGGAVTTLSDPPAAVRERIFTSSTIPPITRQLVIQVVPEPGSLPLFLVGLLGLAASARFRHHRL
jgi:hypothetical protein